MDKITIKELAPYLPYGLKCIWNTETYELHGVLANDKCKLMDIYDDTIYGCGIKFIKPLLFPLSSLTKEIEVNGERFVPLKVLESMNDFGEHLYIQSSTLSEDFGKLDWWIEDEGGFTFNEMMNVYNKLLEWHFDVFGLIERGLAIDKTTINNV